MKRANLLGSIVVGVVCGVIMYKVKNRYRGKHEVGNIDIKSRVDSIREDTFSSIKQSEAYERLLEIFNGDEVKLKGYIIDKYNGSKDYALILQDYIKEDTYKKDRVDIRDD